MNFDLNEAPFDDLGDEDRCVYVEDSVDVEEVRHVDDFEDVVHVEDVEESEQSLPDDNENLDDGQFEPHLNSDSDANLNDEDFDLVDQFETKFQPGEPVPDPDTAYLLYCEYGRLKGFSVTRRNQDYFTGTKIWRFKEFVCSCNGKSDCKASDGRMPTYKKQVRRCSCKAKLRVSRKWEKEWKVSSFYTEHNHELFPTQQSYLLRSARNLSTYKKSLLEAMQSVGISIAKACRFMEKESGGPQNCGFTRKDAYNHINGLKMKTKVENGDAKCLVEYFTTKANTEPFFYWDFELDDEGRLLNFFFRDTRSSLDYEYFGDVLSVDSTYRTNKYKLVCVPFVGVNHHLNNVMYGMGFLSDETSRSYEWLLTTFWASMSCKEPEVIFTDQCQSLMNAVDIVFTTSSHRLCQWHINQNAPSHFGKLNGSSIFKKAWFHCMNGCDTAGEFEDAWKSMIDQYALGDHRWFNTMYGLKTRWSSAFTNHRFCAGLHATSRSEVTNKVLKSLCNASTSLHDFVLKFEEIQIEWRRKETEEDALCIGVPGLFVLNNELMKGAAKVLTRSVFRKIEQQAAYSMNVDLIKGPSRYDSDDLQFTVTSGFGGGKPRYIEFNRETHLCTCTCRLFETAGFLCSHIFKIYFLMNVKKIPNEYLLKRLSLAAKQRIITNVAADNVVDNDSALHVSGLAFANQVMRTTYELSEYAKVNSDKRGLILTRLASLCKEVYGSNDVQNGLPRDGSEVPKGDCSKGVENSSAGAQYELPKTRGSKVAEKASAGEKKQGLPERRGSKGVENASAVEQHELPKRGGSKAAENASAGEHHELPKRGGSKAAENASAGEQHAMPKRPGSMTVEKPLAREQPQLPKGGISFRNPKVAKTRGETNSTIIRHWDRSKSKGKKKVSNKKSGCKIGGSQKRKLHEAQAAPSDSNATPYESPSVSECWDTTFGWTRADAKRYIHISDNEDRINHTPEDDFQDLDLEFSLSRN
ncbi:protein FAR1-RELATED SEQUENCE 5-like [Salvia miltiorrhiza]|uniref:protein FAR1-RELATED SEQUENCE 5-like n=1 Tax=Salvia miltiorrhiza TaxID=226208 RepID=UPI0025ACB6A7|nr:protein FAR1-RELATED SEQUENCE 5-like [Salvia miltiorrhiza]